VHTFRKCLESEWLAKHPLLGVVRWLGNSATVAAKHYHQPTAESVTKVTGAGEQAEENKGKAVTA
jgi:hypothetical protein